jgi:hypothetical protein
MEDWTGPDPDSSITSGSRPADSGPRRSWLAQAVMVHGWFWANPSWDSSADSTFREQHSRLRLHVHTTFC